MAEKFDVWSNKFAQDIYLQKYSMDRQETWADTCKRVVDNVCGQLLSAEDKEIIYDLMLSRKFIPGGRYLYSSGRPLHQVNNCHSGRTRIITRKGIFALKDILGKDIEILNRFGKWEKATVKEFGHQYMHTLTLKDGRTIEATANHRWWQEDGSRVTTLEVEKIPYAVCLEPFDLDIEGVRHGIIYGDGTVSGNYSHILLRGEKKQELANFFQQEEKEVEVGGGAIRRYKTIRDVLTGKKVALQPVWYKNMPEDNISPEYARGFIAGLIATDGSVKTHDCTISCEGYKKAQRIAEIAVLGGCTVTSVRVASRVSPYNGQPRELSVVTLRRDTVPLIRKDMQEGVTPVIRRNKHSIKVVSRENTGYENTYCVVAPESESFTLANGLITSNCFLFRAEDSREGWADLMCKATSALMTGGGIGVDYSAVREEGALIKRTGGASTGPLALMQMVNEAGRHIMQGGQRRSAVWAGLLWKHPDIDKFMSIKDWSADIRSMKDKDFNAAAPLDGTNISVNYDTEFFVAIEDKQHPLHKHAQRVWLENCRQAFSTAEPGMAFNFLKDLESLRNAPVTAATRILTSEGYKNVGDVVGKTIRVWTGEQWAETVFRRTKENADLVKISLSNGRSIICDPEHPFIVKNYLGAGERKKVEYVRIPAAELCEDQKIRSDLPRVTTFSHRTSYGLGFVYGDGSIRNGKGDISFHEKSKEGAFRKAVESLEAEHVGLDNRAYFKCYHADKASLLAEIDDDFVAGWFDADGCYTRNLLRLSCKDQYALHTLQEYLDLVGIKSVVREDGTSSYKPGNKMYTLQVLAGSLVEFKNRIPTIRINIDLPDTWKPYRESEIRVVDVQMLDYKEDVYCCDVGVEEHSFMAEGVVISNCTEVTSEDDSDKCNLGTIWMNLHEDREDFEKTCKYATKFLVCGGLYSHVPTDKIREVGLINNRIGLGLGGMHEWLMLRGYKYEVTPELHKWLNSYERESDASAFITAKELGVAKPKGVRAIAPTGTIGILAETTTGIEPLFCKAYKRRYLKGTTWHYQYVVDGAVKRLQDKGVKIEDIQDAYDISFKERVKFQADVQQYVDMAISSTCNLPEWGSEENNEETLKKNAKVLLKYAKRLRGFTCYPDGSRGGQPLTRVSLEEALSQEGVEFEEKEHECVGGVCGV